jgi:hypothetical protein
MSIENTHFPDRILPHLGGEGVGPNETLMGDTAVHVRGSPTGLAGPGRRDEHQRLRSHAFYAPTLQTTMERLRGIITALAFSLILLPTGVAAAPADTVDTPTPEGFVQSELMQGLTSNSVAQQEQAMRRIRAYAHTERYNKAIFDTLVRPLHDIVAHGYTNEIRLMALSALDAIGSDAAMAGLQVQKETLGSDLVRNATETVLARHADDDADTSRQIRTAE